LDWRDFSSPSKGLVAEDLEHDATLNLSSSFQPKPVSPAAHMPQLDGLRAFAVVAVAISHWTPEFLIRVVPWGTGVQLFFVLSGFLITGILLRSMPADVGISLPAALKVFYIRRTLRIFPLYYGVLALSLLFALGPIRETWPWHVPYLSNIYYAWHGHGTAVADPFLHLWSLSVEEQFYFLWPFIALLTGRRTLAVLLYCAIAGSLAFRLTIEHILPGIVSVRYLTPSCLDALAVGGLIAHARHYKGIAGTRLMARTLGIVGFAGLVGSTVVLNRIIGSENAHRVGHTFLVVFYGGIVAQAAIGFRGPIGSVLTQKPILYLGRISYGLYVFHYFAPIVISRLAHALELEHMLQHQPLVLSAYTAFTLVVSVISWHFYEFPINNLKRHFEYPRAPRAAQSAPNVA
jgi:peptidoglycan/LPS O-acetylase OafA/YrhL